MSIEDVAGHGGRLTDAEIDAITAQLRSGKPLDDRLKSILFADSPEAEILYRGKETRGAILSGTMAVPLQVQKRFGGEAEWTNKLIFGDNLQVLKRLVELKDDGKLKCADGTPGFRMCYIDPPFATKREFRGTKGQQAYRDKVMGAEFIEFLRKRLVFIHELLADDGTLYVHLDPKKGHYLKVVLDEIFGPNNFRNEIIWWYYNKMQGNVGRFPSNHDCIYVYGKSADSFFDPVYEERSEITSFIQRVWDAKKKKLVNAKGPDGKVLYIEREDKRVDDVWRLSMLQPADRVEKVDYPTQKPTTLLEVAMASSSKPGDLVLDAFVGSGTSAVVAERLDRRWIAVDSGKLAIYTTQKRLLTMGTGGRGKDATRTAKPFDVVHAGLYDNALLEKLPFHEFRDFALELFGCRARAYEVAGVPMAGTRKGDPVHVFPFADTDAEMGVEYIESLHERIGTKVNSVVYLIAPASRCDPGLFVDLFTMGKTTYILLRVPYSVIEALHERSFSLVGQPASVDEVNDAIEAYGFDFMQPPDVELSVVSGASSYVVTIDRFARGGSDPDDAATATCAGREELALVLVDAHYDGSAFKLEQHFFGETLAAQEWRFEVGRFADHTAMLIFIDGYGNELRRLVTKPDARTRRAVPAKAVRVATTPGRSVEDPIPATVVSKKAKKVAATTTARRKPGNA